MNGDYDSDDFKGIQKKEKKKRKKKNKRNFLIVVVNFVFLLC